MRRWLLPALLSTLSCFAQAPAAAPKPTLPSGASVEADVAYDKHPKNMLDVYLPASGGSEKRCGVLAIHGGGWINGTRSAPGVVNQLVIPWLQQGCVVASVGYRLAADAPAPAAVEDVLRASEFFRRNAKRWRVDDDRILVTGMSAGGHLALMVGLTPKSAKLGPQSKVAAVVNFYGITDVEDQLAGPNMRQYAVKWLAEGDGRMDLARKLSPIEYVRKDVPPILTLHGTADMTVPYEHGVHLTKGLRDAGADAEMISVPDAGHGFPKERLEQLYKQIYEFARRRGVLKGGRP